jgi:GNAT superfamily N-acetyltransferase
VTAATEPLTTRALRPDDAGAAMALSSEAGWNQTVPDWRFMLGAGEARGQLTAAGALVASALILPYDDRIAWIAMVLTTESHRRRGLATANLHWAIERCAARGLVAGLDATPAGREVYAPLGFTDLWGLQRLHADRPALPEPADRPVIRRMRPDDLPALAALDAEAFGARRDALLAFLQRCRPGCAWFAHDPGGRPTGFLLGRTGRATLHIGPLIASDPEIATALAARALGQETVSEEVPVSMPISIDVPDGQGLFRQRLIEAGFTPLRPFTRMLRGDGGSPGGAGLTFAIAGPELG